jgi:outer membrane protein assembly factor BamB
MMALSLGGCGMISDYTSSLLSDVDNTEPPAPLTEFTPKAEVTRIWSADVGKGAEEAYLKLTPIVVYGKIYAADAAGLVSAYDTVTGQLIWQVNTKQKITGGPGSGDGNIYVGTKDAEVLALDAETGKFKWASRIPSEVLAAPRSDDGVVIARSIDGKLLGLNAQDGKQVWMQDRKVPVLSLRGSSSPVLVQGAAVIGLANGKLVVITLREGKTIWETRIAIPRGRSDLERMVDIDSDPLVSDGVIHAVTFQGQLATLELKSGRVFWDKKMSSYAGLGMDKRYLYVSDDKSHVWSLDRRSSSSLWKQDVLHARNITAPASHGNYVVVGDLEGYLHWFSKDDGSLAARTRLDDSAILAAPITNDDLLYSLSSSGTLAAFRVSGL